MTIQDFANTASVQVYGDATSSSEQAKFGITSLKLDGTGDYVETGISGQFDLSGDLTVEGWIYPTSLSGNNVIASLTADGVNFGITTSGGNSFLTAYHGATTLTQSSGTQVTTGAWQFVSFSRASNNLVISLDGVSVAEGTFTTSGLSGNALRVGSGPLDSTGFAGFMDEVRVTKGNARYSSTTYNVPDSAFPRPSSGGAGNSITIKAWGAGGGGGGSNSPAGGGGFTQSSYTITPGTNLYVTVGTGGNAPGRVPGGNPAPNTPAATGNPGGGIGDGQGGGLVGVFLEPSSSPTDDIHGSAIVIAGSGGGASDHGPSGSGGAGGGSIGEDATAAPTDGGSGGTQSAGGAGGTSSAGRAGAPDGSKLAGGSGFEGAGGGAGYYGGGGGTDGASKLGDGGGGSGYFAESGLPSDVTFTSSSGSTTVGSAGTRAGPGDAPSAYGSGGVVSTGYSASLYLPFDSDIQDDSAQSHTVTAQGDAAISSVQSKFGGSSAYFDGDGDRLDIAHGGNLNLGSDDFTIEGWFYFTSSDSPQRIVVSKTGTYAGFLFYRSSSTDLKFYASQNGSSWNVANGETLGTISLNTWTHLAVTRSGNTFRTYQDGTQQDTWTNSSSLHNNNTLYLGGRESGADQDFEGYIDDFRIIKGTALYTSNFTAPTSAVGTGTASSNGDGQPGYVIITSPAGDTVFTSPGTYTVP